MQLLAPLQIVCDRKSKRGDCVCQEATSQSDLINTGPRQQRPRGKRCTGAEGLEGISVQRAATCSVGRLFQQCRPDSPKLAVPTSSATDILKFSGRGTGASIWDVVCQYSTWHSGSMDQQHIRVLQSSSHQQKALSSFVPPSIFYSVHKLHQIPPSHLLLAKPSLQYYSVLFYAWPLTTACHCSLPFLTPLKPSTAPVKQLPLVLMQSLSIPPNPSGVGAGAPLMLTLFYNSTVHPQNALQGSNSSTSSQSKVPQGLCCPKKSCVRGTGKG